MRFHRIGYGDHVEFFCTQSSDVMVEQSSLPFVVAMLCSQTEPWIIVCCTSIELSLTAVDEGSTLPDSAPSVTAVPTTSSGETDFRVAPSTSIIPPNTPNLEGYLPLDSSTVPALPYPTGSVYLPLGSTTSTTIPSAYLPLESSTAAANPSAYLPLDPSTTRQSV